VEVLKKNIIIDVMSPTLYQLIINLHAIHENFKPPKSEMKGAED